MVYRVARANSKAEKAAVDEVLAEFFFRDGEFFRQQRTDKEIIRYQKTEPDREAKRANASERQKRARDRRKALFDGLRERGIVPPFETPTEELTALLSRHASQPVTRDSRVTQQPVTRDDTATRHQTPDTNITPNGVNRRKRPVATLDAGFLVGQGADRRHAEDWLTVRKRKGAPLTQTAWDRIKREAEKAGISVGRVVELCAGKSWQGFEASWLDKPDPPTQPGARQRPQQSRQSAIDEGERLLFGGGS